MCIYYKDKEGLTYRSKEHVFPAGIGGINKLKKGMVSDQANSCFSGLELKAFRDSILKFPRMIYGPGKRGSSAPGKETKSELTEIDYNAGPLLGYIAKGEPLIATQLVYNGVGFQLIVDGEHDERKREEEIAGLLCAVQKFDGKCSYKELRAQSSVVLFSLHNEKLYIGSAGKLDNDSICVIVDRLKTALKESRIEQTKWDGDIGFVEDLIAVERVAAKTAVNTLAYLYGEERVQNAGFDRIKEFILHDPDMDDPVRYLPYDMTKRIKADNHLTREHCCLFTVKKNKLTAYVIFYDMGFQVELFSFGEQYELFAKQSEDHILNGYICDWEKREEYDYSTHLQNCGIAH